MAVSADACVLGERNLRFNSLFAGTGGGNGTAAVGVSGTDASATDEPETDSLPAYMFGIVPALFAVCAIGLAVRWKIKQGQRPGDGDLPHAHGHPTKQGQRPGDGDLPHGHTTKPASQSHVVNQNGATSEFELCFAVGSTAPCVPGVPTKPRVASSTRGFKLN